MDEEEPLPQLTPGKVDMVQTAPSSFDEFAAVLWVPDSEQRHYWREFWVKKGPQVKPGSRMGF